MNEPHMNEQPHGVAKDADALDPLYATSDNANTQDLWSFIVGEDMGNTWPLPAQHGMSMAEELVAQWGGPVFMGVADEQQDAIGSDAAPLLRCLDSTHPINCMRRGKRATCMPMPPEELEGAYELQGEPGKKNGEKRLRQLVTRTPEWSSAEERERTCALVGPELASLLRDRKCSALRKGHLLALVRVWGYKTDFCVRRGGAKRDATAANTAASAHVHAAARTAATAEHANGAALVHQNGAAQPQARERERERSPDLSALQRLPAPQAAALGSGAPAPQGAAAEGVAVDEGQFLDVENAAEVARYVSGVIRPLVERAGRCGRGEKALEALRRHGGRHLTAEVVQNVEHTMQFSREANAMWRDRLGVLRERIAILEHSEGMMKAQLMQRTYESLNVLLPTRCERALIGNMDKVTRAVAYNRELLQDQVATELAEVAWLEEMNELYGYLIEMYTRCIALAAQARLGSVRCFINAMEHILGVLEFATSETITGLSVRSQWMVEYIREHGPGTMQRPIYFIPSGTYAHMLSNLNKLSILAETKETRNSGTGEKGVPSA